MSEASSGLLCVVIKCGFHSFQTSGVCYITEKRKQRAFLGLRNSDVYTVYRLKVIGTLTILLVIAFLIYTFYVLYKCLSFKFTHF